MTRSFAAVGVLLSGIFSANAGGVPYPVAPPVYNWTGVYIGGFAGGAWATANYCDFTVVTLTCNDYKTSSFIGGGYIGFDYEFANRVVVGAKITAPFGSFNRSQSPDPFIAPGGTLPPGTTISGNEQWAVLADLTFGYDMGPLLPYFGVGVAFAEVKASLNPPGFTTSSATERQTGLDLLVGVKYALNRNWALGVQYNHVMFDRTTYNFTGPATAVTGQFPIAITADLLLATAEFRF